MDPLSLNLFTSAVEDIERTQYEVLAGLETARSAFEEQRVYPHLGRLAKLHGALSTILDRTENFRTPDTGRIAGINWEDKTLTYEWPDLDGGEMAEVEDLIRWALPHIREVIDEGTAVYEEVEDNLELETVGIVPSYVQEGYLMVPHRDDEELHVLRYTLSLIEGDGETHRALKTVHCKTVPEEEVDANPSSVKLQLIEERRDLPTPATYFSKTDLDVPYQETLLPVVKRRLVRQLAAETGTADARRQ
ncbi:hypothetical protein GGP80_002362 [Salinibacter ruber]|jgi:hypothetical protein|nr:hypothetical protein [Salinibacter ruber]MBB4060714.1 hypothetical protein [Salinibacter ruber]MBB4068752.1 hypothetical protein [Salinibacter ruber]MCS3853958.1 hypothetical protein [Salinibacter ruber]MCS3936365.1 hypothetical protein [Salinibacter ruber]MCS4032201.1 hypothetical protein [Salinibacter ruber]